ncbi:hypothetical protein ZIOFF_071781 [Zingiber officinale]|uniref:Protein kinase domain-containing protein n=1 Tax=Zingiber officinale TaxID=94328 RepID=A0A8J5CC04_ZINOF|nr:hypothetical protein ZIOFF_071781 [Zingiber officinale]
MFLKKRKTVRKRRRIYRHKEHPKEEVVADFKILILVVKVEEEEVTLARDSRIKIQILIVAYAEEMVMTLKVVGIDAKGAKMQITQKKTVGFKMRMRQRRQTSLKKMKSIRDLTPENLFVNCVDCKLKIGDFGLARSMTQSGRGMSSYIATQKYRAPELLICSNRYDNSIDMWSIGCILAELLGRRPLFSCTDDINQLERIVSVLGVKGDVDINFVDNEHACKNIKSLPHGLGIPLASIYPHANPLAIDLLKKMLVFDPSKRIDVTEALQHPYMASFYDPLFDPAADGPVDHGFEDDVEEDAIREMMWEEMHFYHQEREVASRAYRFFANRTQWSRFRVKIKTSARGLLNIAAKQAGERTKDPIEVGAVEYEEFKNDVRVDELSAMEMVVGREEKDHKAAGSERGDGSIVAHDRVQHCGGSNTRISDQVSFLVKHDGFVSRVVLLRGFLIVLTDIGAHQDLLVTELEMAFPVTRGAQEKKDEKAKREEIERGAQGQYGLVMPIFG